MSNRPIPVHESLPENGQSVLIWDASTWHADDYPCRWVSGWYENGEFMEDINHYGNDGVNLNIYPAAKVTHWMPIPPAPDMMRTHD